jgi:hypothetical protein
VDALFASLSGGALLSAIAAMVTLGACGIARVWRGGVALAAMDGPLDDPEPAAPKREVGTISDFEVGVDARFGDAQTFMRLF